MLLRVPGVFLDDFLGGSLCCYAFLDCEDGWGVVGYLCVELLYGLV